jgi:[ribosomal protein S5]-alanine N-acetyltransferase
MKIILQTPRLYLRRFTLADAPLIVQLNSKPEVLQYLHEVPVKDEAHATEILTNIILPQYQNNLGRWAAHIKGTDEFIGWCGLKYRPEIDETDLGYRFMPQHWGRGYATEAAKYTLEYGFNTLQLKTITGRAHIENTASLKVLEKIGMQYIKDEVVDNCPVKTFIAENGAR